jgi:hypothetical protein
LRNSKERKRRTSTPSPSRSKNCLSLIPLETSGNKLQKWENGSVIQSQNWLPNTSPNWDLRP